MQNGNLRERFADTGFGEQIGPLPLWDAIYVVTGDPRALAAVKANSTAAGTYSIHYRDRTTGLPVSIVDHPGLSFNAFMDVPAPGRGGNAYSADTAHQPSIGYLAYIVSGDYYHLEELHFWTTFDLLEPSPANRGMERGLFTSGQNRSQAWSLRTLAQSAYITPDADPRKDYYEQILLNNIEARLDGWARPDLNNLGAIQDYNFSAGYYSPWQNDWFVWVFGYVAELGYSTAIPMRDWLSRWATGRMGAGPSEYCFRQASQYNFANAGGVGPDRANRALYFSTFRELYEAQFPAQSALPCDPTGDILTGYPHDAGGYIANMQPGLAIAVDSGIADYAVHWARFTQGPSAALRQAAYNEVPIWAIVPRRPDPDP